MSEVVLALTGGKTAYRSGEVISGRASWRVDEDPTSAELSLFWYTSGKGTQDVGVVQRLPFPSPRREEQRDFTLRLPREPYSCSGALISIVWAVELIVGPGDLVSRCEFVLSGTGQEVVLAHEGA